MSGVFKSIGKIFKKVLKVALKIAPYALAAAAVIFTGGAALGILPSFAAAVGGAVSSLGLSAAVTGALTGAITSAGFGAALGFVTGGKKGMQKGALMGALTGGVLGLASPAAFGIVNGTNGVTTMNALTHSGNLFGAGAASSTAAPGANGLLTSIPKTGVSTPGLPVSVTSDPAVTSPAAPTNTIANADLSSLPGGPSTQLGGGIAPATATPAATTVSSSAATTAAGQGVTPLSVSQPISHAIPTLPPAPQAASTGIAPNAGTGVGGTGATLSPSMGTLNPANTGSGLLDSFTKNPMLTGELLSALGGQNAPQQQADANVSQVEQIGQNAYGGVYSGRPDPFGGNSNFVIPQPRYYYDTKTNTVVDRQGA